MPEKIPFKKVPKRDRPVWDEGEYTPLYLRTQQDADDDVEIEMKCCTYDPSAKVTTYDIRNIFFGFTIIMTVVLMMMIFYRVVTFKD